MDTINFAWWNLQNFFDTDDDPISQDFEFTGDWGWTEAVFRTKLESLAAALGELHAKRPIGLFACCEIEKDTLLTSLIEEANLPLTVVKDSSGTSDLRGIDTAGRQPPLPSKVFTRGLMMDTFISNYRQSMGLFAQTVKNLH